MSIYANLKNLMRTHGFTASAGDEWLAADTPHFIAFANRVLGVPYSVAHHMLAYPQAFPQALHKMRELGHTIIQAIEPQAPVAPPVVEPAPSVAEALEAAQAPAEPAAAPAEPIDLSAENQLAKQDTPVEQPTEAPEQPVEQPTDISEEQSSEQPSEETDQEQPVEQPTDTGTEQTPVEQHNEE